MFRYFLSQKVPVLSFLLTAAILVPVQLMMDPPMLLAERFLAGSGWVEIFIIALYAGWITNRMQDPAAVEKWRRISWLVFSVVFFSQMILGLTMESRFLMTGKLHLPVPAMIIAGPVYRGQISFMTILFLSTVVLTGPSWCSHLCYFGAIDNWAASGLKLRNKPVKNLYRWKYTLFALFMIVVIIFRCLGISHMAATLSGILFGIAGLLIMLTFSRKYNKMIHCTLYCPVGFMVNYLKYLSPFRMLIDPSCNSCMACTLKCKYIALTPADIKRLKPGLTCTFCGECISACHKQAIHYRFPGLKARAARDLYLILTISLHASFIALGRI